MTTTVKTLGLSAAVVLALAVVIGLNWADDTDAGMDARFLLSAVAENGQPGSQHQKLQPFIGDWDLSMKVWTDANQPPAQLTGTVQRRWIMGGRFVQEALRGNFDGKPFEGMSVLGHDNALLKFTIVRICGLCGTISSGLGTCNAAGTRFDCTREETCPVTGRLVQAREEILLVSNDRIITSVFRTVDDKEIKVLEIVSLRKQ